jgi:hypothetical protein
LQDKEELIHVLEYHVVAGQVLNAAALRGLTEVKTLAGDMLPIAKAGPTIKVRRECHLCFAARKGRCGAAHHLSRLLCYTGFRNIVRSSDKSILIHLLGGIICRMS